MAPSTAALFAAALFTAATAAVFAEPLSTAAFTETPSAGVNLDVPFFCQAPRANWADQRQQDGCEETSLLMAHLWLTKTTLSAVEAEAEIIALSNWIQTEHYTGRKAFIPDQSIADAALIFARYYGHTDWEIKRNITARDIKAELAAGNLVIVPVNGRILANPHFNPPGPVAHMIVITGHIGDTFFANDPGTVRGKNFPYPQERLMNAIYDYPTGRHMPYRKTATAMLVIRPPRQSIFYGTNGNAASS
jgi:hypothetical protein